MSVDVALVALYCFTAVLEATATYIAQEKENIKKKHFLLKRRWRKAETTPHSEYFRT